MLSSAFQALGGPPCVADELRESADSLINEALEVGLEPRGIRGRCVEDELDESEDCLPDEVLVGLEPWGIVVVDALGEPDLVVLIEGATAGSKNGSILISPSGTAPILDDRCSVEDVKEVGEDAADSASDSSGSSNGFRMDALMLFNRAGTTGKFSRGISVMELDLESGAANPRSRAGVIGGT